MEKIKKAYEYYLTIKDLPKEKVKGKDKKAYMYSPYYFPHRALFSFLVNEYGFNKAPQVLSSLEYFVCDGIKVYHGFKEFEHGAEFLLSDDYHKGVGHTCGMFFTHDEYEADNYTAKFINEDDYEIDAFKTMACKVKSKNGINYSKICDYRNAILENNLAKIEKADDLNKIRDLLSKINSLGNDENVVGFLACLLKNPSTLAVLMGYDYIVDGMHLIMLNRNIAIVNEYEFNRFCSHSNSYRDITADKLINPEKS